MFGYGLLIGIFIGVYLGMVIMALLVAAGRADDMAGRE